MHNSGHSQKDTAKAIEKDKSVVSRELQGNCDRRNGQYRHELTQRKYEHRQKNKPKRRRFNDDVKAFVDEYIKLDYSPEQVSGRAKQGSTIQI